MAGDFRITIDTEPLQILARLPEAVEASARKWVAVLSAQVHSHILEKAQQGLNSRREMYVEHLHAPVQVDEDTWVVSLDAKYRWIDDGMPAHSMLDDLLKSPKAKTTKAGDRYMVVPFELGPKGPTQMTQAQTNLLDTVKQQLKQKKIPYAKIEKNEDGTPKLGLLHSLGDIDGPGKDPEPDLWGTKALPEGHGPFGEAQQGPTGIPFLKGVQIYQKQVDVKNEETGKTEKKTRRSIVTFRVASEKHRDQGRWEYPGIEGTHFFEEAYTWAKSELQSKIIPAILEEAGTELP